MARVLIEVGTLQGIKTAPNATAQQLLTWYFEATAPKFTAEGQSISYTPQQQMDFIALEIAKHIERVAKEYRRLQKRQTDEAATETELEPIKFG